MSNIADFEISGTAEALLRYHRGDGQKLISKYNITGKIVYIVISDLEMTFLLGFEDSIHNSVNVKSFTHNYDHVLNSYVKIAAEPK